MRALLVTTTVWEDPLPGLEDAIIRAIGQEARAREPATPARRRLSASPKWRAGLAVAGIAARI